MNFEIRTLSSFDRKLKRLAKKYKSLKEDLMSLSASLLDNPTQGADLGGGVRKVRMSIGSKGRGKSGGARVITYTVLVDEESGIITLIAIYDKSEQDTISRNEIEILQKEVKAQFSDIDAPAM